MGNHSSKQLARVVGAVLLACSTAHSQTSIRIEAETMQLDTFGVEMLDAASNGALINLKGPGLAGSATAPFPGSTGKYDVSVVYHDENDGVAQISFFIGGESLDVWPLDLKRSYKEQAEVPNRRTRQIGTGITVNNGDEIRIEGVQGNWDHANVDYVEFAVSGQSDPFTLPAGQIVGFYTAAQVRIELQPGEFGSAVSWCDDGDTALSGGLLTRPLNPQNGTNSPDFNFRLISFLKITDGRTGMEGWSVGGVNESPAPLVAIVGVNATCADRAY